MPLQKQTVAVNFGNGVDNKTDEKLIVMGKLKTLENGVFKKFGRIDKRNGYQLLSSMIVGGSSLTSGSALAQFKDELLQFNKQKLYSYSSGGGNWLDKGTAVSAIVKTKQIVNNNYQQTQCDTAVNDGVGVYAYKDSRGGVRATVFDESTGTTILSDTSIDANASRVRCVSFRAYLYVFYYVQDNANTGSLYCKRINPKSATAFDTAVLIANDVAAARANFDICPFQNIRLMFAYSRYSTSGIKIGFLDETPAIYSGVLSPINVSPADGAEYCLTIFPSANQTFTIAWANATSGVNAMIISNALAIIVAKTVIDADAVSVYLNITGYQQRGSTTSTIYYEVYNALSYNKYIRQNTFTYAGVVGTPSVFMRSVGLWTKAFRYDIAEDSTNRGFIGVSHQSTLQSTYFIIRNDGVIVAKIQPANGGGLAVNAILQNINGGSGVFTFGVLNKVQLISENATIFSNTGVARTGIDFTNLDTFNYAELADNLHIVGGFLSMYDGVSVVEHGFHLYPENINTATSGSAGLANGTYQYMVMWEWKDNNGNLHRSAPSIGFSVTVSGGPKQVDLTIPTLRLTAKTGNRTDVSVVVYRTVASGTTFYRVTSITSPLFNSTTTDTVAYSDTTTDAALISNEILYTVGGELDNMPSPACTYITEYKNRLFVAGLENGLEIWYSKEVNAGQPVSFASELTLICPPEGGDISALFKLDDKVVLFKSDRFFVTYGDGPNNTGQNGEFAKPQFVTEDTGCETQNSLVRVPQGIMFKSPKGIYLLDSQLNTTYKGSPVEDFNFLTFTSGTLKSTDNQVRFTTSNGACLVYDYFFDHWSTFTNYQANDSLIWDNQFVMLKTDGNVYYEVADYFRDVSSYIPLKLVTAWLSFDNVTGYQRIYNLAFLGAYKSPHVMRVKIGYDFSEAYRSNIIFTPATDLTLNIFGDGVTYGSDTPFGGTENAVYRWKAHLTYQKCQTLRFEIEDIGTSASEGSLEGLNLSSIGVELGVKGHLGRFKPSQNIGTQELP